MSRRLLWLPFRIQNSFEMTRSGRLATGNGKPGKISTACARSSPPGNNSRGSRSIFMEDSMSMSWNCLCNVASYRDAFVNKTSDLPRTCLPITCPAPIETSS